jgi:hypothetical protein
VLAHKLDTFYSIMGLCSSWWLFLFPRCMWREWDSCPFHHRHRDTYTISSHAPIQSQRAYFYGCHIWYEQCGVPLIRIDGIWFSSNRGASCLGYHKSTYMWKLGGIVECHASKASLTYAKFKKSCFIVNDAPQEFWTLQ